MAPSRSKAAAMLRGPVLNRRLLLLGLAFLSVLAGPTKIARAAGSDEAALLDALGFLKREKSRAEQHALLLRTVEKTDPAVYEHGIELYMDGKADFDELIEELKVGLIAGQDPARSAKFAAALQEVAQPAAV